jgi:hypothetical protein
VWLEAGNVQYSISIYNCSIINLITLSIKSSPIEQYNHCNNYLFQQKVAPELLGAGDLGVDPRAPEGIRDYLSR